jgi:hypothetical protein
MVTPSPRGEQDIECISIDANTQEVAVRKNTERELREEKSRIEKTSVGFP